MELDIFIKNIIWLSKYPAHDFVQLKINHMPSLFCYNKTSSSRFFSSSSD